MSPAPTLQELIDTVRADAPRGGSLEQLTQASRTVAELEDVGDALLGHFVDRCRRNGHSWSEISAALGVTRQAAHKRFSPGLGGAPTFERFTPRARAALAEAAAQAKSLRAERVGTEHILLALLQSQGSVAVQVLADLDVTRATVLSELGLPADGATKAGPGAATAANAGPGAATAANAGPGAATAADAGPGAATAADAGPGAGRQVGDAGRQPVPYQPDALEALRASLEAALRLGHNYIGTEHLLLALLAYPATAAARALSSLGAQHGDVESRVVAVLEGLTQ